MPLKPPRRSQTLNVGSSAGEPLSDFVLPPTALIAIVSAVISAVTTFLLQTYLAKRVEHKFARQLEDHKAELSVRLHAEHGIATRRLEAYPKIVELCYRARNMARDLLPTPETSPALRDELLVRAKELEEYVFRFRLDLEGDNVFTLVHRYKNLVLEFARTSAIPVSTPSTAENLRLIYAAIESAYPKVVHELSEDVISHPPKLDA